MVFCQYPGYSRLVKFKIREVWWDLELKSEHKTYCFCDYLNFDPPGMDYPEPIDSLHQNLYLLADAKKNYVVYG